MCLLNGSKINASPEDLELANMLAFDLADSLRHTSPELQQRPSMKLLNNLWQTKCIDDLGNPYPYIVMFCAANYGSIEEIILNADLSLSESIILHILSKFGIENENGQYNIENLNAANIAEDVFTSLFPQKKRNNESIKEILKLWVTQVEKVIADNSNKWFKQVKLTSVFYRFIQFAHVCEKDERETLSGALIVFLQDTTIPKSDKKLIVELITEECIKYKKPLIGGKPNHTPIETLFNNNDELIKCIQEISKAVGIKYIDSFNSVVNQTVSAQNHAS